MSRVLGAILHWPTSENKTLYEGMNVIWTRYKGGVRRGFDSLDAMNGKPEDSKQILIVRC